MIDTSILVNNNMKYKHIEDKIITMIGTNGYADSRINDIHKYLNERNFEKCIKLVDNCFLLKDNQKEDLKKYILTFVNAC